MLNVGHGKYPCRWEYAGTLRGGSAASRVRKQFCTEGFILGRGAVACELNVVNSGRVRQRITAPTQHMAAIFEAWDECMIELFWRAC
ncbi:hypothetical protein EMIT0P253_250024 [Pseudomonas sp. IT-P253]